MFRLTVGTVIFVYVSRLVLLNTYTAENKNESNDALAATLL